MVKRYKKAAWGYLPMGTETVRVNPRTANALKARGGFNLPPAAGKHLTNAAGHIARGKHQEALKAVKSAAWETAKSEGLKAVHKIVTEDTRQRPLRRGKRTAESIDAPGIEAKDVRHACHMESLPEKTRSLGSMVSTIHKTYLETGRPTTNAIWQAAKQQGIVREVMYDSKIAVNTDQYAFSRNQLDHSSGFNSRNFVIPGPAGYANLTDIRLVTDNQLGDRTSSVKDQDIYGLLMDTTVEYQFHNQSAFHSMDLKVHLVKEKMSEPVNPPCIKIMADCVNTNIDVQEVQAVPTFYQHSSPEVTLGNSTDSDASTMGVVDLSLKGSGLKMSSDFRNNYKIVKTVSKKMAPGDNWNFRHTHYYGGGFDMKTVFNAFHTSTSARVGERFNPCNYFYIFEVCGRDCEGVLHESEGVYETYIGKSPAYYTFECRKSLRYVPEPKTGGDIGSGGITTADSMQMKFYSSDPMRLTLADREFFKLPGNITSNLALVPVGDMYIPVMSDSVVTAEKAKSRAEDD